MKTFDVRKAYNRIKAVTDVFTDDYVFVYAAQSSFFLLSSSIPFIMLLISLSGLIFPDAITTSFEEIYVYIPEKLINVFTVIKNELLSSGGIPLLSVTALIALWTSSKSIRSLVRGVANIYDAENIPGFFKNSLYSLLFTLVFLILIVAVLLVLAFGVTIRNMLIAAYPESEWIFSLVLPFRGLLFFTLLTLFFSLLYFGVSKGILRSAGTLRKYRSQIPGAAFAAAGWMIFSYGYSVYLRYFPTSSYIYGGLAAIMLLLFWLYFCMVILLAGAEVNKLLNK